MRVEELSGIALTLIFLKLAIPVYRKLRIYVLSRTIHQHAHAPDNLVCHKMKQTSKKKLSRVRRFSVAIGLFSITCVAVVVADEKRAPAPKFSGNQTGGIFFDTLADAFGGARPTLSSIKKASEAASTAAANPTTPDGGSSDASSGNTWTQLISPESIEDEIKRVKLHYDGLITTPGAFNGGGYQDARVDLTILATLFAVITEHEGDVRWKKDAAAARDMLARTAFRCSQGSTQVYNEAKTRKDDLQDLISGSGLASNKAEPENDWSVIADRSPMMEYAEYLKDELKGSTNSEQAVKSAPETVRRHAELLAIVGKVLTQEGMDEADDDDYKAFSDAMTKAATSVVHALEANDYASIGTSVGAVTQSCDDCHGEYR